MGELVSAFVHQFLTLGITAQFLDFLSTWGTWLAGIAGAIFTLSEFWFNAREGSGERDQRHYFRSALLLIGSIAGTGYFAYALLTTWEPKDPMRVWQQTFSIELQDCLTRAHAAENGIVIKGGAWDYTDHLNFECLDYAWGRHPINDAPKDVAQRFQFTQRRGQLVQDISLSIDGAPVLTSKILEKFFGIYRDTFIGAGLSLPTPTGDVPPNYGAARLREFLLPNYCADEVGSKRCPPGSRSGQIWTWVIDSTTLSTQPNLTVSQIVTQLEPQSSKNEWDKINVKTWLETGSDDREMLVRFSQFPISAYQGSVGRAEAEYVFFSSLRETWSRSLINAAQYSGRNPPKTDKVASNPPIFLWVFVPNFRDEFTLATWENVFLILDNIYNKSPEKIEDATKLMDMPRQKPKQNFAVPVVRWMNKLLGRDFIN
jgi:hypothetical protein